MLMVEPTNFCNLKCPLCPSGNGEMRRPRGTMGLEDFEKLVDQLGGEVFMMMLWNQGEPYINKCFNQMVRYASDRGIFTFTSTNGHFVRNPEQAQAIVESGLDEMIVSLDGVDQETYEKYRVGGQIERVFFRGPPARRSQRGTGIADATDQLAIHRYETQRARSGHGRSAGQGPTR